MLQLKINRVFNYTFKILEVESQEGGDDQRLLDKEYDSIVAAILAEENLEKRANCTYYVVVDYSEA